MRIGEDNVRCEMPLPKPPPLVRNIFPPMPPVLSRAALWGIALGNIHCYAKKIIVRPQRQTRGVRHQGDNTTGDKINIADVQIINIEQQYKNDNNAPAAGARSGDNSAQSTTAFKCCKCSPICFVNNNSTKCLGSWIVEQLSKSSPLVDP